MNEGEFDKLFNNKFKDFEGSDFSTTEWGGLEDRLNQRDNKRRGLLWLFPILLFTALAGGGAAIWYNYPRNDKQEFPQQQLIKSQSPIIKTDTLRDTIIRRTIIYQNDTIFRKLTIIDVEHLPASVVTNEKIPREININSHSNKPTHSNSTIDQIRDSTKSVVNSPEFTTSLKTDKSIVVSQIGGSGKTDETSSIRSKKPNKIDEGLTGKEPNEIKHINILPLSKSEGDTFSKMTNTLAVEKKEEEPKEQKEEKELKPIIKKSFHFPSIFLGLIGANGWKVASDYKESGGNQIGIRGEAKISEGFNFFAEVNYGQPSVESSSEKKLPTGVTLPEPIPLYDFQYWTVDDIKSINYIGGIQYKFKGNSILKPYISVGVNGSTLYPYKIKFEYKNAQDNTEKYVIQDAPKMPTEFKNIYASVGVHWLPLSRLQFSIEGFTSYPLKNAPLMAQHIGLKAGVLYLIKK